GEPILSTSAAWRGRGRRAYDIRSSKLPHSPPMRRETGKAYVRTHASKLTTALALTATVSLAGCFGPTYGTGETQVDALMNDLGNSISLGDRRKQEPINFAPRADVVRPSTTATLPTPQENIARSSDAWPESPEELRARVLTDIENDRRDPNFITSRSQAAALGASEGPNQRALGTGNRRFLTDPPAEYRIPADTAEAGDLGVSEAVKARQARAAQGEGGFWRNLVPWL
ncbi:MAG: hypothetical protein AAFO77_15315, partial [Pseudomonadota bacterium]